MPSYKLKDVFKHMTACTLNIGAGVVNIGIGVGALTGPLPPEVGLSAVFMGLACFVAGGYALTLNPDGTSIIPTRPFDPMMPM